MEILHKSTKLSKEHKCSSTIEAFMCIEKTKQKITKENWKGHEELDFHFVPFIELQYMLEIIFRHLN
jgi:hypothetical protein